MSLVTAHVLQRHQLLRKGVCMTGFWEGLSDGYHDLKKGIHILN